jgi:pyridoxine 5-phosphate synthase
MPRSFVLELDALTCLREATAMSDVDLAAATALAELAGVDAVRVGVNPELVPVREDDVRDVRHAAHQFELRMSPADNLLKVALETRPDRVLLAADSRNGLPSAAPLDLRGVAGLGPILRALADAGIVVNALVAPDLESVKLAHAEGLSGVEFFTGGIVDLPHRERKVELEKLSDAVRLASKLQLGIGLVGGLGYRSLREVIETVPAVQRVALGRAAVARAVLVGLDRALRDLRVLLA